ncbi:MAG: LD-carboxypeptidase [Myxococcales bacterium]
MAIHSTRQLPAIPRHSLPERRSSPALARARLAWPSVAPEPVPFVGLKGSVDFGYHKGPALLAPGSRVGILCDTLHGDREIALDYQAGLAAGAALIRELGFEPVIDRTQAAVAPYFERWAGSPEERVRHVVRLLDDYRVDAVFPLFGKGGCHGVVDALAESSFRPRRPVVLLGGFSHHSDWALFAQSQRGQGFFSHAISTTQCAYWEILPSANVHNLRALVRGASSVRYTGVLRLNDAAAAHEQGVVGPLSGGNLSAILLNRDKEWMPDLRGRIVLCEDYDRHAHDFHRTFSSLARQLERTGAAALLVGAMLPMKRVAHAQLEPEARKQAAQLDRAELDAIVSEVASRTRIPVYRQPEICGHGAMNYPLGMGGMARIEPASDGSYTLENQLEVCV